MPRYRLATADWSIPGGVFAFGALEAALGVLGGTAPRTAVVLGLIGISCAALVVRRHHALAAFLIGMAALAVQTALGWFPPSTAETAVFAVSAFSCGRYGRRPYAYAAVPVGAATVAAMLAAAPGDTLAHDWPWTLFVLPVFVLGAWFRQQRRHAEREASRQVRAAVVQERVQIARELHDVLAHSVTLMVVQAEAAEELLGRRPDTARASVRHIQRVGREALQDTRRLLAMLRAVGEPSPHAPLPGLAEVPALVATMKSSGLPVDYRADVAVQVPAVAGRAVYRVVQEALTNTLRHAGPVPTTVTVGAGPGLLTVEVRDSGDAAPAPNPAGHGLLGMRERVESCGGTLLTGHGPGGFRVRAEIPLDGGVPS